MSNFSEKFALANAVERVNILETSKLNGAALRRENTNRLNLTSARDVLKAKKISMSEKRLSGFKINERSAKQAAFFSALRFVVIFFPLEGESQLQA